LDEQESTNETGEVHATEPTHDLTQGVRDEDRVHVPEPHEGLRPRGPIMTVFHGYRVAANRFAGFLGVISAFLIFPTVIISIVNVILRRVGSAQGRNLTSNALIEAQWYLYTLIFVFGLAYILRDGINVRVDFWFGNRSSKTQSWIDLVGHFIGLIPLAYIGIKYSWPSVKLSWDLREQSPDAGGLARYPIKTALMFAFVFLMIQGIAEVIKTVEYLRGHEYRYEQDAPALAAGQKFEVTDFDVGAGRALVGESAPSASGENGS
jgi:TRAP-type mannitol/chloroaromatic compound transport system permease small subunit